MRSLEQLDRWIAGRVKGWATKVAGGQETPGLLEIRRDILEDVRDHIEPAGDGRSVFSYNYVLVRLAPSGSGNHLYESALACDHGLEADLRALLAEARTFVSPELSVIIETANDPALVWQDRPFRIEYINRPPTPASASRPSARLIVVKGQCDPTELAIDSDRVNLGRLKEVTSEKDGLHRRNDLAFADSETTVSREHASIRYDASTGRFRVYDSKSNRGTRLFRDGRRIDVPRGGGRGIQLHPGDEIHLGDARVLFEQV
jgi:hypothetical protein